MHPMLLVDEIKGYSWGNLMIPLLNMVGYERS